MRTVGFSSVVGGRGGYGLQGGGEHAFLLICVEKDKNGNNAIIMVDNHTCSLGGM